jgi:hypothetical protein
MQFTLKRGARQTGDKAVGEDRLGCLLGAVQRGPQREKQSPGGLRRVRGRGEKRGRGEGEVGEEK